MELTDVLAPLPENKGWQLGLSVLQCNEHMYHSKMAADMCFNVGDDGDKVWAHSYMLVSRSPVFERLVKEEWCGALGDIAPEGVDVEDIELSAFNEMLRYVYHEKVNLDNENVFSILYASKKYKLLRLTNICREYIFMAIGPDTVCDYLTHSIQNEEQEIEAACVGYATRHASLVLQSKGLQHLSQEALLKLVKHDGLQVEDEKQVYDACVRWAMGGCSTEDTNLEVIRCKLGQVFKHIRFPRMSVRSFAEITQTTAMLSKEEQLDIMWNMLDPDAKSCKFDRRLRLSQRRPPQGRLTESVIRFDHADTKLEFQVSENACQTNAISFTISRNVYLVGISLFVGDVPTQVDVVITENNREVVAQSSPSQNLTQDQCDIFINDVNVSYFMFDTHVHLEANQLYTLSSNTKYLCPTEGKTVFLPRGTHGRQTVRSKSGAIVTFWNAVSVPHNGTDIENGQFPQLLFTESM